MNMLTIINKKLLKSILVFCFGLLLLMVVGSLTGKKALAFSTTDPIGQNAPQANSADIIGGPTTVQPWFAVGEGQYDGTFSYAKIYLPNGFGGTLTVRNGNGVCPIDVGSPKVNYVIKYMDASETLTGGSSVIKGNTGGCGNITFNITGGSAQSNKVGHTGYHVYYFEAQITGPGVGDNEKNFRLNIATNSGGPQSFVGVSRPAAAYAKPWFGIYMRDAPQRGGTNWSYEVQFAPWCNETSGSQRRVTIHDIDYGVYPQPNLSGLVDKDNRADSAFGWGLAPPGYNSGVNAVTSKRVAPNDWPSGNNTNTALTLDYNNLNRYLLEFRDINWHNTIQISLPFDQFDALQSVGTSCVNAGISCNVTNPQYGATIPVNQNTQVTITGAGSVNWVTDDTSGGYYIKRIGSNDIGAPTSEPNYVSLAGTGPSYTDTVHPPPGTTQVIYTYEIYNRKLPSPYGTGVTCDVTYQVSSGIVSATCSSSPPTPGEVGQTSTFNFVFHIVNTTPAAVTITYGYINPPQPTGSITNVTGPNPPSSIVNPTGLSGTNRPVSFTALINYSGTLTAYAVYNGNIISDVNDPLCSPKVTATALPYFQAWNSGVSAGGGFKSSGGSCNQTGDPPYITPVASNDPGFKDQYSGDIRAFGKQAFNPSRGSRTDFGAVALGLNPGSAAGPIGFFSGDVSSGKRAVFANNLAGIFTSNMGGYLNSSSPAHCVDDFYSTTQANPGNSSGDLATDIANCAIAGGRCQYIVNSGSINLNSAIIPAGMQLSLYVNGNVTVNGNITYNPTFDATNQASVPYFALIVKGNIYVSSGANQLDGLYIAQPSSSAGSDGVFATCATAAGDRCNSQLVVNGAVIAQHVELLRVHGTLDAPSGTNSGIGSSPAEIFNFTPSLIIGNPAFASQFGKSEILFSLPPVF